MAIAKRINYKGWIITYDRDRPITGQWRGERYGVGVSNNSLEAVKKQIDYKTEKNPVVKFPEGKFVKVQAIRVNRDGTVTVKK